MRLGFFINPIAGMGGRVGLKGTNDIAVTAIRMGAKPVAPARARDFLEGLRGTDSKERITIVTCASPMGKDEVEGAGFSAEVLPLDLPLETSVEDTRRAVRLMVERKVDLIVFVGGDGTARDVFDSLQSVDADIPVLGVPSGVKMYSGIFAVNSQDAAAIVAAFVEGTAEISEFEILDTNENAVREDKFDLHLYGFLRGPFLPMRIQGSKQVSPETLDEHENQLAIAKFIVESIDPNGMYILGPGTTVKCVADLLGVEKTLLGVDIYGNGRAIKDVNEETLLQETKKWQNLWVILSPVGRQGVLLGRGNQQISPKVIKRIDKEKIIVGATKNKLQSIEGGVLRVDTGDAEVDNLLRGYIRVVTDYREWRLVLVR